MNSRTRFGLIGATVLAATACQPDFDRNARRQIDPVSFGHYEEPIGLVEAGQQHLVAQRYGSAVEVFRQQLKVEPDNIQAIYGLALAYQGVGRDDLSDRWFARAQRVDTRPARYYANLAYRYRADGQYDRALALYDQALAVEPQNEVIRQAAGETRRRQLASDRSCPPVGPSATPYVCPENPL